ncbi:MAG: RluA family pseudouridine synthase [Planctomycetota bacterium]|jgi:23S rRNA pseudouridine955/2504/2580 synthase/23S rRNA pseudouridine1911/1915/1917 synthase
MPKVKVEIIYQDEEILVVNKPGDVSVTKDRSGKQQLTEILAPQLGEEMTGKLCLIHQMDKHTSGVMMLALNKQSQSEMTSYFEKRLTKKTYLAIVRGIAFEKEGVIEAPIARSKHNPAVMCINRKKGKQAITRWRLLADFVDAALLAVSPITGRTHQLRVHLPSIGLPLAIDPIYGGAKALYLSDFKSNYRLGKGQTEKPLIERLTLHAYQLELPDSENGRPNCFIAPLDKKFKAAIKMLTRHNPNGLEAFTDKNDFEKIINNQLLD